jgi:eukaryotic-like serine/threonine-protein kinase
MMFAIFVSTWVLLPHLTRLTDETDRLFTYVGIGLFIAGVMYLVYLAIEPFVRRSWPTMLVGWSRALAGQLRDAVVGRDLIVGTASGVALTALTQINALVPGLMGWLEPVPMTSNLGVFEHSRYFVLTITTSINNGLQNALLSVMIFTVLREIVKRVASRLGYRSASTDYVTAAVVLLLMIALQLVQGDSDRAHLWLTGLYQFAFLLTFVIVLLRYGLLATFVMFTANALTMRMPLTLSGATLYSGSAWLTLGLLFAVAGLGLWMARGGEPVLGTVMAAEAR